MVYKKIKSKQIVRFELKNWKFRYLTVQHQSSMLKMFNSYLCDRFLSANTLIFYVRCHADGILFVTNFTSDVSFLKLLILLFL